MNWRPGPLWHVFEAHGIDVATMSPRPLQGPQMVPPPAADAEHAALQRQGQRLWWQHMKRQTRLERYGARR